MSSSQSGAARTPQSAAGKINWSQVRLLTAILLAAAGGFLGIYLMISGEHHMVLPENFNDLAHSAQTMALDAMVSSGLQPYCTGFGIMLLLAGIAYMLIGYQDKVRTNLEAPDED